MVSHCLVEGCKSQTTKEGGQKIRAFHTYPVGPLRHQWNRALNMVVELSSHGTVCSDHFPDSDYSFKSEHKWALKSTAVPKLNIPRPLCKEEVVQKEHETHQDYILPDFSSPPTKKSRQDEPCDTTSIKSEHSGEIKKLPEGDVKEDDPLHSTIETKLPPVQQYVQNSIGNRNSNPGNDLTSSPAALNRREKISNEDHAFHNNTIQNLRTVRKNIHPETISKTGGDNQHKGHVGDLKKVAFEKNSQKQDIPQEVAEPIKEENEELRATSRMPEEQMKKQSSKKNTLELFEFPKSVTETEQLSKTNAIDEVSDDYEDIKRLEDLRILIKDLRGMEEALQRNNSYLKLRVGQMEERIMKFKCKVAEKVVVNDTAANIGIELGKRKERESSSLKSHQENTRKVHGNTKKFGHSYHGIKNYSCPAPGCTLIFYSTENLKMHLKTVHSAPEVGKISQGETRVSGGVHTNEWELGHVSKENNSNSLLVN